ncbi:hypothetical protein N2152v2_000442 [Parachlorella kessleri]
MPQQKFAVVGAGGGAGKACVDTLLQKGLHVRAVVRDPQKAEATFAGQSGATSTLKDVTVKERLELVKGDVTDPESLKAALAGCKGVVFAASGRGYWSADSVDFKGVKNVADAAKELGGVERVVVVSSALVTPKNRFHPVRILLNNIRWGLMDAKLKGEDYLRKSGVPYTIVRPGGLSNDAPGQVRLVAEQGDKGSPGRISRADVAAVCCAALTDPKARNVTLELAGKPWGQDEAKVQLAEQLKGLFQGLSPDQ